MNRRQLRGFRDNASSAGPLPRFWTPVITLIFPLITQP